MPPVREEGATGELHSHTPRIARVQHLFRQLQKRLPGKRPAGIKYRRRAPDVVAVRMLHLLNHTLDAPEVGDVSRDADGFAAGGVDGVDDGDVGVWVAGEEGDGVGGGKFAGDGGAGLGGELGLVFVAAQIWGGKGGKMVSYIRLGRRRR